MPLKAIHSPNACVVRPDSSVEGQVRKAPGEVDVDRGVLSNPESFLFSENKNGYGKVATSYHTNHLVKSHAKWFRRFNHFSETLVRSNLKKGVL